MQLPYRVDEVCPGEGCSYGAWLACDSVPLYGAAGDPRPTEQYLRRDETFEVTSGTVIVDVPEVVVVTRPTRQVPFSADARTFAPGDTVYVLDYLGEGFFNAWYAGSILEVEVFWPWQNAYRTEDFEYGGEVIQSGQSSFWIEGAGPDNSVKWIFVDSASVAAPSALDPTPLVCP